MQSVQPPGAFRTLWARAGLWRFCLLSALLLTLLSGLFLAQRKEDAPSVGQLPSQAATYVPQSTSTMATANVAPLPAAAAVQQPAGGPTVARQRVPAQAVATVAPPLTQKAARLADPAPRNADISLANAGGANAAGNGTGIDNALLGRTYSGSVVVNGYKLPLPAGNWAMLSNTSITIPTATGMAYFFGRVEHKHLTGAIRVTALRSKANPGAGFPELKRCKVGEPNNSYTYVEAIVPQDHEACWFVFNYYTPPWQQWADRGIQMNVIDRAAAGDMAAKGVSYPQDLVGVQFGRAEKWGFLEVSYLFSPEAEGIATGTAVSFRDSDWHSSNVKRFPEKAAYIEKLRNWGEVYWPLIKTAFADTAPASDAGIARVPPAGASQSPGATPAPVTMPAPAPVYAGGSVSALDIHMGDSVNTVKSVLKTGVDPMPVSRPSTLPANVPDMNAGKTSLHLVDKGIWVFFDQNGRVYTVRVDAPYAGEIKGIRVGDDAGTLRARLGEPLPSMGPVAPPGFQSHRYVLDETRYVRFDVLGARIRTIFIMG